MTKIIFISLFGWILDAGKVPKGAETTQISRLSLAFIFNTTCSVSAKVSNDFFLTRRVFFNNASILSERIESEGKRAETNRLEKSDLIFCFQTQHCSKLNTPPTNTEFFDSFRDVLTILSVSSFVTFCLRPDNFSIVSFVRTDLET